MRGVRWDLLDVVADQDQRRTVALGAQAVDVAIKRSRAPGSRPAQGSSRIKRSGFVTSARAIMTRCFSPCDSTP